MELPSEIDQLKMVGDLSAVGITVGTVASYLPAMAALITIVWTGIRIYETKTVRRWLNKYRR